MCTVPFALPSSVKLCLASEQGNSKAGDDVRSYRRPHNLLQDLLAFPGHHMCVSVLLPRVSCLVLQASPSEEAFLLPDS